MKIKTNVKAGAVVLRQNLVTIDIVDFLQPSATLYWYEGITILAILLFQNITQLDFVHSEIGARADLRMDKVRFNC
jgi:hypothetical protein